MRVAGQHYAHSLTHKIEMKLHLETDPSEVLNEIIFCTRKVCMLQVVLVTCACTWSAHCLWDYKRLSVTCVVHDMHDATCMAVYLARRLRGAYMQVTTCLPTASLNQLF